MVIGVKTVYRHPKGRFEVRETTHHAFGNTYTVREAFLTPDEDRRRLPEAMRIRQSAETEDKPENHFVAVSDCEAEGFAELYRDNVTIDEIARHFHRTQPSAPARRTQDAQVRLLEGHGDQRSARYDQQRLLVFRDRASARAHGKLGTELH